MTSIASRNDERINGMSDSFFAALDDYKKYYVYHNKNPEINEYQTNYDTSRSQLITISNQLYELTRTIQQSIIDLDTDARHSNRSIEEEKELNKTLVSRSADMNSADNGTEVMVNDAKAKYNRQYYMNWEIFLGLGIVGYVLATGFKVPSRGA